MWISHVYKMDTALKFYAKYEAKTSSQLAWH